MIKIAECGNIVLQEGDISSLLKSCANEAGTEDLYIREFSSPIDLIDFCVNVPPDTEPLDLLVCSMDLPGITGVQLVTELHDAGIVPFDTQAVLCAPSGQHAYDAYVAGARGFLLEPIAAAEFRRVVGGLMAEAMRVHKASLVARCRRRMHRIEFSSIRYIETSGHDQVIHLDDGREPRVVRSSSNALFLQLKDDGRFFKVGSSFIANLDFVRHLSTRTRVMIFDDGFQLPVPVRCLKTLGDAMAARGVAVL